MFGAGFELASVMEFGFYQSAVRDVNDGRRLVSSWDDYVGHVPAQFDPKIAHRLVVVSRRHPTEPLYIDTPSVRIQSVPGLPSIFLCRRPSTPWDRPTSFRRSYICTLLRIYVPSRSETDSSRRGPAALGRYWSLDIGDRPDTIDASLKSVIPQDDENSADVITVWCIVCHTVTAFSDLIVWNVKL